MRAPAPAELPPPGTGRRRSLLILAGMLILLPAIYAVRANADGFVRVTTLEHVRERGVLYVGDMGVFLVDASGVPIALSERSTHLGDRVLYCESSSTFMDPAHGSKWDRLGYYLDGPAPRGLDHVQLRVRDGSVEVDPRIVSAGPSRGSGPPARPSGPFCGGLGDAVEGRPGFAAEP